MFIAYLPFTSSNCVRRELIPILNETLGNLPEAIKGKYVNLMQTPNLPEDERKQLKQHIHTIKDKIIAEKLINQYHTLYIILHLILPKDQWIPLKNTIAQVTSLKEAEEADQCIASQLPKQFKQLNEHDQEDIYNLSDDRRKRVLTFMTPTPPSSYEEGIDRSAHKDATASPSHQEATAQSEAIHKLIQEGKAQQDQEEDVSQDDWGDKLPLKGKDRMGFLNLMVEYNDNDQKALKKLFDEVDADSVRNLAILFARRFTKEARKRLVTTMIYLYKGWPVDTIKMCNNAAAMSWVEKWKIFRRTTGSQLDTLQQLDKYLQELIENPDLFKTKYAKEPNDYIGNLIDEID